MTLLPYQFAVAVARNNMQLAMMAAEAQMVISMRLLGMAGMWNVSAGEDRRMVAEKPLAFTRAAMAAWSAAMTGKGPEQIMAASIRPVRRKTRSNARRLGNRAMSRPKR